MIKRCMSVGLALSMLLSLTPITAIHADEVDVNETQVLEVQENLDDVKKAVTVTFKNVGQIVNDDNENNSFWGDIYFTDSSGKPIPYLDFELSCTDMTTLTVKTDENGMYSYKYVYSKPKYYSVNPVRVTAIVRENDQYLHSYGDQYYPNMIKWFNFTVHEDEKYPYSTIYPFKCAGGLTIEERPVLTTYEDGTIVFDAWYDDEARTIKHDFTKQITSNVDIYAKWKKIEKPVVTPEPEVERVQITYSRGDGKVPNVVMRIPKTDDYELREFERSPIGKTCAPPDKHYFKEWLIKFADGTETRAAPGTKIKITQNTVFIAQWARLYEVKVADSITNGSVVLRNDEKVEDKVVLAKEGEVILAMLKADEGYYNKNVIIQQSNGVYLPWKRNEFNAYLVTFKVENQDITFDAKFASLTADPEKPTIHAYNLKYNGKEQEVDVLGYDRVMMKIEGNKAKDAGTYTVKVTSKTGKWSDGSTDAVTTEWKMETVQRPAPTGLKGFDTSYPGANDGRITGVTDEMEYIEDTDTKYYPCTGTEITGLKPGLYNVKYKDDKNHKLNIDAKIEIKEGSGTVPTHTHTYGAWSSDTTSHWHECTDASCSDKAGSVKDKVAHIYDNDADDTCNICGYKRTLPTYNFIDGTNGEWIKKSSKDLDFKTDGEFSKFTGVKVDGTLIGVDKYTAVTGSTLVTLKKDYLETLSVGKHTLTVVYTDGECTTEFEVKNKVVEKPETEEDTKPGTDTENPAKPEEDKKPGTDAEKPEKEDAKPSTNIEKPTTSKVDKKKDVKSDKKKSLNTAYSYNMGQWMTLLLMSGLVLALTVFKKKRN